MDCNRGRLLGSRSWSRKSKASKVCYKIIQRNFLSISVIFTNNNEYLLILVLFFPASYRQTCPKNTFALSQIFLSPSKNFLEQLFPIYLLLGLKQNPQLNQLREECQMNRWNHGMLFLAAHLMLRYQLMQKIVSFINLISLNYP